MGLLCSVGGVRGTFEADLAAEVSDLIDQAFGAEGEWEGAEHCDFGELDASCWDVLQDRAVDTLGSEALPNLLVMGHAGRGVFLPASLRTVALPMSSGRALHCASLTGLRRELFELAERWGLPVEDGALARLVDDTEECGLAHPPEVVAFARLMIAANEAMRRDSPLWLVG